MKIRCCDSCVGIVVFKEAYGKATYFKRKGGAINYLRDRFFDKDGKLNLKKQKVEDAIKNKLTLLFNDFPNLKVENSRVSKRPKNPRKLL